MLHFFNFLDLQNADVNVQDTDNRTPLLLASSKGGWRTVHCLLQNGADISIKDKENGNFLHLLIRYGGCIDKFGVEFLKVILFALSKFLTSNRNQALAQVILSWERYALGPSKLNIGRPLCVQPYKYFIACIGLTS